LEVSILYPSLGFKNSQTSITMHLLHQFHKNVAIKISSAIV
jgi:hypothetical protein